MVSPQPRTSLFGPSWLRPGTVRSAPPASPNLQTPSVPRTGRAVAKRRKPRRARALPSPPPSSHRVRDLAAAQTTGPQRSPAARKNVAIATGALLSRAARSPPFSSSSGAPPLCVSAPRAPPEPLTCNGEINLPPKTFKEHTPAERTKGALFECRADSSNAARALQAKRLLAFLGAAHQKPNS